MCIARSRASNPAVSRIYGSMLTSVAQFINANTGLELCIEVCAVLIPARPCLLASRTGLSGKAWLGIRG